MISALAKFPKEAEFVGRLITNFSELELDLCHCVANAIDNLDMTVKALYRARGETQRVEIADALGRQAYHRDGLGTQFEEAIAGMRVCLRIRNQFAHAYFHDDLSGKISFLHMEEIAKGNGLIADLDKLTFKYLDMSVLIEQRDFFAYIGMLLQFLNFESRTIRKLIARTLTTAPKKVAQPRLHL